MRVRRAVPRRQGLQVHVGERRWRAAGAHDVHVRGALRVQPLHLRPGRAAVGPGEQEGQLLLRTQLQLLLLQRHGLKQSEAERLTACSSYSK